MQTLTFAPQRPNSTIMISSAQFHKDFVPLKIATHEICVSGLAFRHSVRAEAITALLFEPNNAEFSWKALNAADLTFELERENDHSFLVHVRGDFSLATPCVRCLSEIAFELHLDFTIRMLEMKHLGMDEHTLMGFNSEPIALDLSEDEEGLVGYFSGTSIDLGLIVRDQIFLDVPDYPHCELSKDALKRGGCKVLSPASKEDEPRSDNPFVKKFGQTKR